MIKQFLENAIRSIENEKARLVQVAKERATTQKVVPHNQEVDTLRDKALAELQLKHNEQIRLLQEEYAQERQKIISTAENNKAEYTKTVIEAETALVAVECETNIAKLKKQIEELKE